MAAVAATCIAVAAEDRGDPWIDRLEPFGGQRGAETEVAVVGRDLSLPATLEFDSPDLSWETAANDKDGTVRGIVRVAASARPGPHVATLVTSQGRSNARLFYVDEMRSAREAEPNDTLATAQRISLDPQTLHGGMPTLRDVDFFVFDAEAGERRTFDLRSLEYGGFLENNLSLLDADGNTVAFNDDRDDYLETPFLEHAFRRSGTYYLKLDQYRGPQRVNCHRNCGYMLRIGDLPVVEAAFPLGVRAGSKVEVSLRGRALGNVERVWMAPVRRAEYYRLTFPFTMPLRTDQATASAIDGEVAARSEREAVARFGIPDDAWRGLWRLWVQAPGGVTDSISFEVSDTPEPDCQLIEPSPEGAACNGVLEGEAAEHEYRLRLEAGRPVVATTLAAQLGLPRLDTVLELFDSEGHLVAEHDDLMTGQGTVIGNPDSMLHYRPDRGGLYRLAVRDRLGRSGADLAYRLRIEEREPRFALLTNPENLNVLPGSTERVGVLLVPEPGFERAVEAWLENPPEGIAAEPVKFRPGQFFGPSGDGDNVVIPQALLEIAVARSLPPGDYPIRILGRAARRGIPVEAISTLWIGPPRKRNDVRRPLEMIRLTVLHPPDPEVATDATASLGGFR